MMDFNMAQSYISKIPSLEDLRETYQIKDLSLKYSSEIVEEYLKNIIEKRHNEIVKARKEEDVEKLDFSFDYYINKVKKELVVEKGRPIKKVINCMGTVYSKYIGDRFYSIETLENFNKVFGGYNNLELDEEKSEKISLDLEIEKLFSQILGDKKFLLVNNMSSAIYLVVDSIYKNSNVLMNMRDNFYLSEGIGFRDIIEKTEANLKMIGYINRVEIEDYKKEITKKEDLIIYTDIFENNIKGHKKIIPEEIEKLNKIVNSLYLSNKIYLQTNSEKLKNIGKSLDEILAKDFDSYILDLSKLAGMPNIGVIIASEKKIKKMKENHISVMTSTNKENKVLFYLTLKMYLDKKYNNIYINKSFLITEEQLKEKNRRFVRILEREIGDRAEINLIDGSYLTLSDELEEGYNFETELIYIKPLEQNVEKIEKKMRLNDPSILCWMNDGALLFNLGLIKEEEENIIIEFLSKKL